MDSFNRSEKWVENIVHFKCNFSCAQGGVGTGISDLGSEFFFGGSDDPPPPPSFLIWYVMHTYVCISENKRQTNYYIRQTVAFWILFADSRARQVWRRIPRHYWLLASSAIHSALIALCGMLLSLGGSRGCCGPWFQRVSSACILDIQVCSRHSSLYFSASLIS